MRRIITVKKNGRIVIPKEIRQKTGIDEGTTLMLTTYPSNTEEPNKILMEKLG